jgi:phosphoglycerate dehydrogenase-like enzyme
MRVAYTDPQWALDGDGRIDPTLASLEVGIYGDDIEVGLGIRDNGRFVASGPQLFDYVRGADAIVVYRCTVTRELLDAAGPTCRVIARQGVGLDNLRADLVRDAGKYAFHVPDYCGDEVSTHAIALLLALERGVCQQDVRVRAGRWSIYGGGTPRRTADLTVGIVGFGRIARATTRKLQPLCRSVVAYDPYVSADLMTSHGVARCEVLTDLMAACDAVLLHAELTTETELLINADVLSHARPGATLINTARGKLVDPVAVLEALRSGVLGGFASDVFSPEDPNDAEETRALLHRDDVIVSAHRAFLSAQSEASLRRRVAEGVLHVLRCDEPPPLGRVA